MDRNGAKDTESTPFEQQSMAADAESRRAELLDPENRPWWDTAGHNKDALHLYMQALTAPGVKWLVLFLWLGVAVAGIVSFTQVFSRFSNVSVAPPGTDAKRAYVPVQAVFTIGVTLVVVFGSIAAVCNGGFLDYTNNPAITSAFGLFWLMPILGLVIVVGLGLDYDVFVTTKIQEEFQDGWDTDAAIIRGVARSGGIISYTGAIQAIAFGGLLNASLPLLNQLSLIVAIAVITDTFIVRSWMVPAMMSILGKYNWLPGRRYSGTRTLDEDPVASSLWEWSSREAEKEREQPRDVAELEGAWGG